MPIDTITFEAAKDIVESLPVNFQHKISSITELRNSLEKALSRTYVIFARTYPELASSVFDEIGIKPLATELVKFISGDGEPDPKAIAKAWTELMPSTTATLSPLDLAFAAITLVDQVRRELISEPAIQSLLEQRTVDRQASKIDHLGRWVQQVELGIEERRRIERGKSLIRVGDYKSAIDEFNHVLAGDPTNVIAMDMRREAIALERMANNEESRKFVKFILESPDSLLGELTPEYLSIKINPYLIAIANLQSIINEIQNRPSNKVLIKAIAQNSPISVSLDGASQALQTLNDNIVPWRRKHAQTMAQLIEQEKFVEIESKRAEVLEKRAHAEKERLEANKQREETEKIKLENEKLRIELHRAKIELALEVLNSLSSSLSETDKIAYLIKLLPPLDIIATNELNISIEK